MSGVGSRFGWEAECLAAELNPRTLGGVVCGLCPVRGCGGLQVPAFALRRRSRAARPGERVKRGQGRRPAAQLPVSACSPVLSLPGDFRHGYAHSSVGEGPHVAFATFPARPVLGGWGSERKWVFVGWCSHGRAGGSRGGAGPGGGTREHGVCAHCTPAAEEGDGVERTGCGTSMEPEAVLLSVGSPGEVGGLLGQEDAVPRPSCPWRKEGRAGGPSDTAHYEATACIIDVL